VNWEQKLAALIAAGGYDTAVRMRKPGDWYVDGTPRVAENGMLIGAYGNGATPEEAVNETWRLLAESGKVLRVRDGAYIRWNGYMWSPASVEETKR
jgi:hypothetical protein